MLILFWLIFIISSPFTASAQGKDSPLPGLGMMTPGSYGMMTTSETFSLDPCSKQVLRGQGASIANSYKEYDISESLENLKKNLKDCGKSTYGIDVPYLESLVKASRQSNFERIKSLLDRTVPFQKVDKSLEEYINAAKSIGMSDKEIAAAVAKYKDLGNQSYARERNSCKPVDMSPGFGPVRDQDSMGWCYAFVAADLLSYKLKQKISAADLALNYTNDFFSNLDRYFGKKESDMEGGYETHAMRFGLEKGLCPEKDFPSEDNSSASLRDNLDEIEKLRRDKDVNTTLSCDSVKSALAAIFPNLKMQDVQEVLRTSAKKSMFFAMADKTCKRIKPDVQVGEDIFLDKENPISNAQAFADAVDKNLNEHRPVSISYNSDILYNRSAALGSTDHASIVVGRRFNDKSGQCEYLVRNSWGRGCDSYDPRYECKEGNIWIPKSTIATQSVAISYVK